MKKITLISAAVLCIFAAFSCNKETDHQTPDVPGTSKTIIKASLPETKTALGAKEGTSWPNYWKTGDQISVNGVTSEALDSEADGKASASFTFTGDIQTPYYAAYPASAITGYSAGSATVTIPATQNYVAGTYDPAAFIMGGNSTVAGTVNLTPFVSVFHLSLTGAGNIKSIKLVSPDDEPLSGSFTTDFSTKTAATTSSEVEMVAATPVALDATTPVDFFICVPAGLQGAVKMEIFDDAGGSMKKKTTIATALAAGQMYKSTLAYSASFAPKIYAEGITSSTAIICWDNAPVNAYTINVYSDSGCSTLVDSYTVDAGNACWGGNSPRFCISGLTAGSTYYVQVLDVTNTAQSNVLPVVTSAFTIVEVSSTPAAVNDVILAEDFGELRWDSELIGRGVGYFATSQDSFANSEVSQFLPIDTNSEKVLGAQATALGASRLAHWAQGEKNNLYIHPGYIKLVGSKNVTHIVTPALNNIPDGKLATIEVEVTASPYFSESSASFCTTDAIVAVQTGSLNELTDETKTNTLDLTTNKQDITLEAASAWKTYKVTLSNVVKGNRIAFGAADGVSGNDARMLLNDIKITIKALDNPSLTASVKSVSSSTAAFTWTYGGDAADDIAKPYTASLYSDAACTNLVVSHHFDADASCWSSKSPCFSFGGLAPSTTYWLVVEDTADSVTSDPVSVTTEAFTPVDATTVSNAAVGDVILAEDFSEIGWGPDILSVAAGFEPSTKAVGAPSGANPEGSFIKYDNTGSRFFGAGVDLGTSRLSKGWGFFGNSSVYLDNGYSRVGASGGRTHLVTPALSGIPAGKVATLDVTITATKYDASIDIAVFAEKGLTLNTQTSTGEANYRKYTGASLNVSKASTFGITTKGEWQTKTARIHNVDSNCHLIIGSLEDHDSKNRFYISDVTVTIVSLKDQGTIDAVMEINDFDTFKAFLTACEPGKLIQGNVTANISLSPEQVADIDALYPVADFEGILNGNNHTIAGLTKPLFDELTGSVSELTLNSVLNITTAQSDVGILANKATGATISRCTTAGSVTLAYDSQVSGSIALGGMVGVLTGCTLTNCQNQAAVDNTTGSSVGIFIGGLAGESDSSTFVACSNTAGISNSGLAADFSGYPCDLNMGGLVGYMHGVNILTGTSSEYNSNSGNISETSESVYVGVGGIAGSSAGVGTDMAYAHNSGKISYTGNTRYNSYIGGIVGCAQEIFTMDYSNNSGDLVFRSITVSHQVWAGGILGGFNAGNSTTKSASLTVTGCSNSGMIDCVNDSGGKGGNLAASSSSVTAYSYFGGITGTGDCGSKQYINCTNSGAIKLYMQLKIRAGGICGYTTMNPTGCVNTGPINVCRYNPQSNGGNGDVGGIVGYASIATFSDLKNDATVRTTGSSPNCFTGGIIGHVGDATTAFLRCKVGSSTGSQKTISGAGENAFGSTAAGLFTSDGTANAWDFTDCVVKTGTKCSNVEVTSENLADAVIGRKHASSITNPPTIGSID